MSAHRFTIQLSRLTYAFTAICELLNREWKAIDAGTISIPFKQAPILEQQVSDHGEWSQHCRGRTVRLLE